jgi:hypothetical protein
VAYTAKSYLPVSRSLRSAEQMLPAGACGKVSEFSSSIEVVAEAVATGPASEPPTARDPTASTSAIGVFERLMGGHAGGPHGGPQSQDPG